MNKRQLPKIIVLMAISSIGLLLFQVVWVQTLVATEKRNFSLSMFNHLNYMADAMEWYEINSIAQNVVPESDTIPFQDGPGLTSKESYKRKEGVKKIEYIMSPSDSMATWKFDVKNLEGMDSSVIDSYRKKIIIENVVEDLLGGVNNGLQEYDKSFIDSVFNERMGQFNKDLDAVWYIIDDNKQVLETSKELEDLSQYKMKFKRSLFQRSAASGNVYLVVAIEAPYRHLLQILKWQLIGSFALIIITLYCFYFAVRIILRQKKVSDIKNDFINNVTHELKTPIATIGLATEALLDKNIVQNQLSKQRYLHTIQGECEKLDARVQEVLEVAYYEENPLVLSREKVDLSVIIQEGIKSCAGLIEKSNSEVVLNVPTKCWISADKDKIKLVVGNLLENAIKYSNSKPLIKIEVEEQDLNYKFIVQDQGIGIKKMELSKIFNKFYRVSNGNLHNVKGFGLGLYFVKKIIELHNGKIWVRSDQNEGTIFYILLPKL